ncbi:fructose-1,6-bisphosphatase [Candidatus Micrarchaeota archaeon]|nr:fructose-1,6-bisphosphatase [Candidatus Micrarchaeota archaeon]
MFLEEHLDGIDSGIKSIILNVAEKTKEIQKAFFTHNKLAGTKNVYNEEQLELDKFADKIILSAMEESNAVKNFVSEEQSEIIQIVKCKGNYGVVVDPLDGISCVKTNLAVGTILGVFDEGQVLEKGKKMDAAMYVLYGPQTSLVYTAKKGVHEFVLSPKGRFVLRAEDIKIPEKGKIYGSGGFREDWSKKHLDLIEKLEKQKYKLRVSGCFTADFQQILTYGGLFSYPVTKTFPQGKLRLLFECNPIAFIAKNAGGDSTDGKQSILELKPEKISDRTPIYVGGKKEIELAEKLLK